MNLTYCLKTSKKINFKVQGIDIYLQPEDVLILQLTEKKVTLMKKTLKDTSLSIQRMSFVEESEVATDSDALVVALSKTKNAREDLVDAISKKISSLRQLLITGKDTYTDRRQYIIITEIAKQTLQGNYPDTSDLLLPDIMERTKRELIV